MTLRSFASRGLLLVALAGLIWTIAVVLTGGFRTEVAGVRLSSRSPRNTLLATVIAATVAWLLAATHERHRARRALRLAIDGISAPPAWLTPAAASLVAAATTLVGLTKGSLVAAGADVYGYVSQAHLWAHGGVRIREPLLAEVRWPFALEALTPLGYTARPDNLTIVPMYSPGLPIVMAILERIGGSAAVFYVVPLLGGLTVLTTYVMGARLGRPAVGLMAAVLLATSPVFVFHLMLAMSDVPATAWWTLALVAVSSKQRTLAFASGIAASLAILTRPNLVVAAAAPALWLWWEAAKAPAGSRKFGRFVWFVGGVLPGCVAVAIINAYLYGAPWKSGYGSLTRYFALSHIIPNLGLYSAWMWQSQTPAIFLAVIPAVLAMTRRAEAADRSRRALVLMWSCFAAVIFACYLPYSVFDNWFWLRFVLPAWPVLLVLASLALVTLCGPLPRRVRPFVVAAVVLLVVSQHVEFLSNTETWQLKSGEQKSREVGEYIARQLPERAVFLGVMQTGSVRYYANRTTIRFDRIPPGSLDRAVDDLRRLGYRPYVVVEEGEELYFKRLFQGQSRLASLDWPPVMVRRGPVPVRIYDLAEPDRQRDREPEWIF